jgi:hypothetical protein
MSWTVKNSGVVLTPRLRNYLDELSSRLPFDIVVTSGVRTPERQAKAMFKKIELGDDLIALYRDDAFAQSVIDAYPNLQQGSAAVQAYIDRGGGSTMHLSGNAVDIRTRDKTQTEIDTIMATVRSMGDRALYEPIPPHIDISLRSEYPGSNQVDTEKKSILIPALVIGGLLIWTM